MGLKGIFVTFLWKKWMSFILITKNGSTSSCSTCVWPLDVRRCIEKAEWGQTRTMAAEIVDKVKERCFPFVQNLFHSRCCDHLKLHTWEDAQDVRRWPNTSWFKVPDSTSALIKWQHFSVAPPDHVFVWVQSLAQLFKLPLFNHLHT